MTGQPHPALSRMAARAAQEQAIESALLNRLFDAGGSMPFNDIWGRIPGSRRQLFRAISRQYVMGNIKRQERGGPVVLTSSARVAIAAGRAAIPHTERTAA